MSLAVAIEAANAIVLAADSRATFGDPRGMTAVNDTVQKVFTLTPRTAIAMVGAAEAGASLIERVKPVLATQAAANADGISDLFRQLAVQNFSQWFGAPQFLMGPQGPMPIPRPDVHFLLVGYGANSQARIMGLGSTPPFNFAPNLSTTGFAAAGIVPLAVYLLNRLYRRGLDVEIAKDLAVYCIQETASQDGKVGGPISLAVVRPNVDTALADAPEIERIVQRVDQHRESLKNSFLNSGQPPAPQQGQG